MNNNQAAKFHQENAEMIQQLIESLDAILERFNEGIIPGEPEKSDAMYMLDTYLDCLMKFKESKSTPFKRIVEIDPEPFNESKSINELLPIRESLILLIRLGREKMIQTKDIDFETYGGKTLIECGYCDEITVGMGESHYYILSEKGEQALKNKSFLASIRKEVRTAVMPQCIMNDSFKWSDLYVRRVEMINMYFETQREKAEHIIFSLDESKEMVFGCEANDSNEVEYIFAGIFNEKIDDHISQIKNIVDSGKIDRLIIINSSQDGRFLLEREGINSEDYPQIRYELIC